MIDEGFPGIALRHITAIEQQISCRRQRLTDGLQCCLITVQVASVQNRLAKIERSGSTVRDNLDRIQSSVASERRLHLPYAILVCIEQHPFRLSAQASDQGLKIGNSAIDENKVLEHGQSFGELGAMIWRSGAASAG